MILRNLLSLNVRVNVVDISNDAQKLALKLGPGFASNMASDDLEPGGIIIATPASGHFSSIKSMARFGVPIFVEKPMTVASGEALGICDMDGPPVFVMHTWRYHAGIELLQNVKPPPSAMSP